jgi:hypothetical protein
MMSPAGEHQLFFGNAPFAFGEGFADRCGETSDHKNHSWLYNESRLLSTLTGMRPIRLT